MHFSHALTRLPGPDFAEGLTTAGLGAPDLDAALAQHAAYRTALAEAGVAVDVLPALPGHPDACFVEDTAVIAGGTAVLTRPGHPSRRGEVESMAVALAERLSVRRIAEPARVDGGDVLDLGTRFVIGLSDRTDAAGARALGAHLEELGFGWSTAAVGDGLHLKCGVNRLDEETLLCWPEFAGLPELSGYRRLLVDPTERYAANVLAVNGRVLAAAGFPRTLELLDAHGFAVTLVDSLEYRKMDGGLTCLSLRW